MLRPPMRPTWTVICLECSHLLQQRFHSRPALPRGFFRRTGATPVRLQADGAVVSITFEGPELPFPIDHATSHGRPFIALAGWLFHRIFAMDVAEPVPGQKTVTVRIRCLATLTGVSRVPVEHQMWRWDRLQSASSFGARRGVARHLVLQHQNYALPAGFAGGIKQFGIDVFAVWNLIVKPPKVETAYAVCSKSLGKLDTAFQNFILLVKSEVGVELISFGTEL